MAAVKKIDIFRGVITYNTIALYANGTKKRFTGFIVIKDEYNNETSYKINSFRSQVTIQGETLGERGMKGLHCSVHGEFKENTWNGETKWELMAEKIFLDGYEQLAADAEAAAMPLPQVPPGSLPTSGTINPMVATPYVAPTGPAPVIQPNIPAPIPGTVSGSLSVVGGPAPLAGGYVHVQAAAPIQPNIPAPIQPNIPAPIQPNIPAPIAAAPIQPNIPTGPIQQVEHVINFDDIEDLPD